MNRIIRRIPIFFWLGLLFLACEEDPEFPDPKFDSVGVRTSEVRRDTADVTHLKCFIDAPNGIDRIEILEGRSYEVLDVLEEYRGIKELEFDYQVDISDIMRDTSLAYIVKVYDLKYRTYNKAFVVNVRKFSIPEVIVTGGETVSTDLDAYSIRALLTTGMIPISQVRLTVDGVEQEIPEVEEGVTEYQLACRISLRRQKEYKVQILLEDMNGRRTTKNLKIFRVREMDKPVKIICGGQNQYEILLRYDAQNRITAIDFTNHYLFGINYEKINGKDVITSVTQSGYGAENPDYISYIYQYDENGLLQSLKEVWGSRVTPQIDKCYYDGDRLTGFIAGSVTVKEIAYEDLPGLGTIMSEVWISSFPAIQGKNRVKATEFQTMKIPTYFNELPYPMLVPFKVSTVFQDVFLSRYVYLKMVKYLDVSSVANNFSYETDEKGRLSTLTRVVNSGASSTSRAVVYYYQFVYKDTVLPEN